MRTTELCEMIKSLGKKKNLIETDSDNEKKKKRFGSGKPDKIIIGPPLNTIDQRR